MDFPSIWLITTSQQKHVMENEYMGSNSIYLQKDKTHTIYFKQWEPAIYDIRCEMSEIQDNKSKERMKQAGFICKKKTNWKVMHCQLIFVSNVG
jgi:hypothetical protein